jgi:hypothetical protein
MVQALLNTKPDVWPAEPIDASKPFKWQTRRVIKPQPANVAPRKEDGCVISAYGKNMARPKYHVGNTLYVRETWCCSGVGKGGGRESAIIDFKAGGSKIIDIRPELASYYAGSNLWRPPVHMPRNVARLFLEVKNIRVERLQDISDKDAEAEGVNKDYEEFESLHRGNKVITHKYSYKQGFKILWDSFYAKRGYGWDANPYVFVYEIMRRGRI